MSNIFVDEERLRDFAHALKGFRADVSELTQRLNYNLNQLSDSWKDQEFDNFRQAFETAQQRLKHFSAEVEQTVPQLERHAEAAKAIHEVKPPSI